MAYSWQRPKPSASSAIHHPYAPKATQAAFHASNRRFKGLKGAKGSGKTRSLIEESVALCYEFPGNIGIVARKDYTALARTTMPFFLNWMPESLNLGFNQVTRRLTVRSKDPANPSTVYFVQEKNPKEFESMEIGFFAIDEADECPLKAYQTLQSRLRLKNVAHYGLMAFNPPTKRHWLYKFFVEEVEADPTLAEHRDLFSNNTFENLDNLPSNYIDELKRIYSGDELNRFLYGEWGSSSNEWAVFSDWRTSFHVAPDTIEPVMGVPIIRCWDFGMHTACLWAQLYQGQLRVLHEVVDFNKGAEEFVPECLNVSFSKYSGYQFLDYSDPTFIKNREQVSARTVQQVVQQKCNIFIQDGAINWQERLSAVNFFLSRVVKGQAGLQVSPQCETLIAGFEGDYRFKDMAINRLATDVFKNEYSHIHDCLQHAAWIAKNALVKNQPRRIHYQPQEPTYDIGVD